MSRGSRRTSYVRDTRGRFASTPGGGAPQRPPTRRVSRGTNRLTRDNSGRITSVGGNGATARGGRLRTGAGNLRARQTMAALSNGRMASVPKGTIGRTRKQREITMIDRPMSQRQAYNEGRAKQMAAIAARKAPKASAPGRIKAGQQKSTIRNTTGQSKTLNKFNSRPAGTMVIGRGYKLVPSPTRVPLRVAGPGSKDSDRAFARVATKAARSRAASAGRKAGATAVKKPAGWMQSPKARKDRVELAADRKSSAKKLRALPKEARRAIQVERLARRQKGIIVAGNTARQLTNIAEGRVRLIGNVGKRKDKLTPGQIGAIARSMSESARRLRVGMAMGRRGRMKYNPNALQIATGTAARKIRGARPSGTRAKPRGMKPGALAAKRTAAPARPARAAGKPTAKQRAAELQANAAKLRQQGEALMGGGRRDGAATNVPLTSRARRNETSAGFRGLGLSGRADQLDAKARRVQADAMAARARKLYAVHGKAIEAKYAAKMNIKKTEVRSSFKAQSPAIQVRLIKQFVRDSRGAAAAKPKKKAVASNATAASAATAAKSIKPGTGKAPKRISYLLAYHGTNKESAVAIRAGGYKQTRYGTYGDGVYATTSRKAAREYASWRAAGGKNKFGEAFPASTLGPAVLAHRIPRGRVNKGDLPGYMIGDWVKSGKARRVSKQATGHSSYVVMNEQLANRTLVNRSGTIRRPRKPRRKS